MHELIEGWMEVMDWVLYDRSISQSADRMIKIQLARQPVDK